MRGEFCGLQRLILDENPYAHYIHYFAHQCQLVIVVAKCCSSEREFFEYTSMVANIVNVSCRRHDQLVQEHHDEIVRQLEAGVLVGGKGKNQLTDLARPSDTRWELHHRTLCQLVLMRKPVLKVLENLFLDAKNVAQRSTTGGLIKNMGTFEFVLILHIMIRLLGIYHIASKRKSRPLCVSWD
jgi:hypothetical protein